MLRHHLRVGEHRHEARVAGPARDDVHVHVLGDAGSGGAADVAAEVEAGRPVERAQRRERLRARGDGARAPSRRRAAPARPRARTGRASGARTSTGTCSAARTRSARGGRRGTPRPRRPPRRRADSRAARPPGRRTRAATAPRAASASRIVLNFGAAAADDTAVSSIAARPTCVVADDHPPVLESVARFLELKGFRIVGRAGDGRRSLALVESQRPALAMLDLRMPGLPGAAVIRRVARTTPQSFVRRLLRLRRQRPPARSARRRRPRLRAQGRAARCARPRARDGRRRAHVHRSRPRRCADPHDAGQRPRPHPAGPRRAQTARRRPLERVDRPGALRLTGHVRTQLGTAMAKLGVSTRTQAVAAALRHELIS